MLFCSNCGKQLDDNDKFCSGCGQVIKSVNNTERKRKVEYKGTIHKCPNCGEILDAFTARCPSCDYEIRGASVSDSVKDFSLKLENADSDTEKAAIIKHFPIPNDKEDIWEFLILAASNVDGTIDSEISDAWLVKLEQVMRKADMIFDDKESVKVKKQYEEILKKLNKEKTIKNARKFGFAMAELVPVFPQFITIFVWILSMMILIPKCRIELDVAGANGYQLFLIVIYIAGAIFVPFALRCDSILPKLETTAGIILSIVLLIPLLKENLDVDRMNAFHLLFIIEIICAVVIIVRAVKYNKKLSERSASFNIVSLIIILVSMVIWLVAYGIGSIGILKQIEISKTSPVITADAETDDNAGIHSYEIRNYVGKNVGSVGKVYGGALVDEYGAGEVSLFLFTEDGLLILPTDEMAKKNYIVVGQNVKPGSKITIVNQRDSSGKPYNSLVDYQSIDEIILYIAPKGSSFEPAFTVIEPTLDKHKYHIKDYIGRNAATIGTLFDSDRVDVYNNAELRLSFTSEDGSYIDINNLNVLKEYIVIDQDISPNTELIIEYKKDSNDKEYDKLIASQNYEEITLTVKKLDSSIIDKMPLIEAQNINDSNTDYVELSVKYKVINGDKAEITGFSGEGNHVTIERKIDGYEVVSIGESAFKDCTTLETILFWGNVDIIDDYAFAGCTSLREISIPNKTTKIGAHAFDGCTNLSELIIWGNPEIDDYAFAGCESITDISISHGTKRIGTHAFDGCKNLESVIVWDEDTVIEKDAFANCPKLKDRSIQE